MTEELHIEPQKLAEVKAENQECFLLDCREAWEHDLARLDGATLIPMRTIPARLDVIPRNLPVIVFCHQGMRSLSVALWLRRMGYKAHSLNGGIDRWAAEIDPQVPRY